MHANLSDYTPSTHEGKIVGTPRPTSSRDEEPQRQLKCGLFDVRVLSSTISYITSYISPVDTHNFSPSPTCLPVYLSLPPLRNGAADLSAWPRSLTSSLPAYYSRACPQLLSAHGVEYPDLTPTRHLQDLVYMQLAERSCKGGHSRLCHALSGSGHPL